MSAASFIQRCLDAGVPLEFALKASEAFEVELHAAIESKSAGIRAKGAARMAKYRAKRRANGLPPTFDGGPYIAFLKERDGELCVYCGATEGRVVDHMWPVSANGTDEVDNLALACHPCNGGKAGKRLSDDGREIINPTARAAYVRYVARTSANAPRGEQYPEHGRTAGAQGEQPRARVRDISPSSEISGEVVVAVVGASAPASDDWPEGGPRDHAKLIVQAVASVWLDPDRYHGLVATTGRLLAWRRDGASWQNDVLPVITGCMAKRRSGVQSWKFFDQAIAQSIADNRRALDIPEAATVIPLNRGQGPPSYADQRAAELAESLRKAQEIVDRRHGKSS